MTRPVFELEFVAGPEHIDRCRRVAIAQSFNRGGRQDGVAEVGQFDDQDAL